MNDKKLTNEYIKCICTMIARGDINTIDRLKMFLNYADLDTPITISHYELNMLLGINTDDINPEYYNTDNTKKYYPIDLILYSCLCNEYFYFSKKELFKEIIKLENMSFYNIAKTLEFCVSKGNLELFKILNKLDINYNYKYTQLKNGEYISILDNCLSIVICRLTINGTEISRVYPKEIFYYLINLKDVDFSLLKSTKIILETLLDSENIKLEDNAIIFEKAKEIVENYK